jgi:predicted PurR-regulated permease PerM
MQQLSLTRATRLLVFLFLFIAGLWYSKSFLVPVAFGGLFAMLFVTMCKKLEEQGLSRAFASVLCVLTLVLFAAGIFTLMGWQMSGLAEDLSKAEQQITGQVGKLRQSISNTLGVSPQQQQQMQQKLQEQQSSGSGGMGKMVMGIMSSIMGILTDTILVLVYAFLFLYSRARLKRFILRLVSDGQKEQAMDIMMEAGNTARKYLSGLSLMIVMLWVMYGIGFSIAGVKHALFFAVLCGLLELVPFVGNLVGTGITLIMALAQGGDTNIAIGVLATYAVVQFVQTYILEPLVVGSNVSISPLFTILVLVLGETIWGIPGMVLSIPILAILKIIFDRIPPLKPYGYLIGEEEKGNSGLMEKIKGLFGKKEGGG